MAETSGGVTSQLPTLRRTMPSARFTLKGKYDSSSLTSS